MPEIKSGPLYHVQRESRRLRVGASSGNSSTSYCSKWEIGGSMWHNVRADHPSFLALPGGVLELFPIRVLCYFYRQLTICLSEPNLRISLCRGLLILEYLLTMILRCFIDSPWDAWVNFSGLRDFKFAATAL